jgi:folate-binding protein YgfZ
MDLPQRGILQLTGRDRHAFLNNLLTNQTWDKSAKSGLAPHTGVYAYFLNLKGRIVADMNVLELGERTLLETDVRRVDFLRAAFEKYIFSEQVTIESKVGELSRIALHGPEAAALFQTATGQPFPADLAPLASTEIQLFSTTVTVFRDDECPTPGHHLIVPTDRLANLWTHLITGFSSPTGSSASPLQRAGSTPPGKRPLRPIGWAAYNACRIEAGRPLFDIDFGNSADPDQSVLPAETGPRQFARAVSVTKGCYLGQEIVARMHARQQVAKQLVGLRVNADALPIAGAQLFDDKQNAIGAVTSSTISPLMSNAPLALAYLKKPFFTPGTIVTVPAEGAMRPATVTELPFLK